METKKQELIRKKASLFHKLGKVVHVVLTKSGKKTKWYNGKIKELKDDFFIVEDKKGEIPVLFSEVYKIEVYERNIN